jgi:hypothetical protein
MKFSSILAILWVSVFVLAACAPSASQPTTDANAIYTAAAVTMQAQQTAAAAAATWQAGDGAGSAGAGGDLTGSISGSGFPVVSVYAFSTVNFPSGSYYYVDVQSSQGSYSMSLPAGDYYMIAYAHTGDRQPTGFVGGYTNSVGCGTSPNCSNDHTLMPVTVANGVTLPGVDLLDFQLPEGAYPPMPGTTTSQAPASGDGANWQAMETLQATPILPLADCQAIHDSASAALQYRFTMVDAPYTDPGTGQTGMVCHVEADGTGADFDALGIQGVIGILETSVIGEEGLTGWKYDPSLQADGPTGTSRGYRRGSSLLTISVSWEPTADANCPSDQPISACVLTPEQKLYIIMLEGRQ